MTSRERSNQFAEAIERGKPLARPALPKTNRHYRQSVMTQVLEILFSIEEFVVKSCYESKLFVISLLDGCQTV